MDRMIYVAMSGAKQMLAAAERRSRTTSRTRSTTGFRAQLAAFRAAETLGDGAATRAFVVDSTPGADFTPGADPADRPRSRRRDRRRGLDRGAAARRLRRLYTRNGSLQVNVNGVLQTRNGLSVLGDGGPIAIPADVRITVGGDGTVSTVPNDRRRTQVQNIGRIKLVNPPEQQPRARRRRPVPRARRRRRPTSTRK